MAERKIMGYWDCPACGAKGVFGTQRNCPNCGKARDESVRFYMKSKDHDEVVKNNEYLTEEQAEKKGHGPDWECPYCGSLNSALDSDCQSCGHTRESTDRDYFEIKNQKQPEEPKENPEIKWEPKPEPEQHKSKQISIPFKKILLSILAVFAIIGIISGIALLFQPKERTIHVTGKSWEYTVSIEKHTQVEDSDWSLPSDAELIRTQEEIHHYDKVIDHYETKTRTYTERVKTGSHIEYSYVDNGDGSFTEKSHTVDDYDTVTKTEEYEDPVYRDVPVYKTKYYYRQWRWIHSRNVVTKGGYTETPAFGDVNLANNEREANRTKQYSVTGLKKDKTKTYSIDEENWNAVTVDKDITVTISANHILAIK